MRSRPFGTIAIVLAVCAGPVTLASWLRAGTPTRISQPERHDVPIADRPLPSAHSFRERKRSERGVGDRPTTAFERGVAAYNVDDAEAAVDAFEEAVRLAPEQSEAHINLGLVYLRLQRPEDALRELTIGASLAKSHPGATTESRRGKCND